MEKKIRKMRRLNKGTRAVDGAGVNLVRVLGNTTVEDFDPFLMLDSFDSTNPEDYTAGFPMHPHRGIETITYLIEGEIEHQDSLGNKGTILPGESQWMTAGSGIIHQEMPQAAERMLGLQIWLNLPRKDKMTDPEYFDIKSDMIGETETDEATVRVLSGEYNGVWGVTPKYINAQMFDFDINPDKTITIPTRVEDNVFVFLIEGDAIIEGKRVDEKTAVLYGDGDMIEVTATPESHLRMLFFSAPPLDEPVSWGGPIVMNTDRELDLAFQELHNGTFLKHEALHKHSQVKKDGVAKKAAGE